MQLRGTTDFKWTSELQQTFDRVKELTDGTLRLAIRNSEKPVFILCDAFNYGIGLHSSKQTKKNWENGIGLCKFMFIFHQVTQTLNHSSRRLRNNLSTLRNLNVSFKGHNGLIFYTHIISQSSFCSHKRTNQITEGINFKKFV